MSVGRGARSPNRDQNPAYDHHGTPSATQNTAESWRALRRTTATLSPPFPSDPTAALQASCSALDKCWRTGHRGA
jgi:hypothetical protein